METKELYQPKAGLIMLCKYYKGEAECTLKDADQIRAWNYEREWIESVQNETDELNEAIVHYVDIGLQNFSKEDRIPKSLKAFLFYRFSNVNERTDPEAFKKFYNKLYK